jgi:dihydrolipoamide dehydrogenase
MLESLPESLAILGAGAIGMEFASIMSSFGVEVTVIEMLPRILPNEDAEVVEVARRSFKRRGIVMHTGAKAQSMKHTNGGVELVVSLGDDEAETITAEKLLVAVGRAPNSEDLGLEEIGVKLDRGFVQVGDYYQTAVNGVYAIGDVISTPLLAHVASKEGEIAVEHMAGRSPEPRLDPHHIPSAVYCEPQVASFGLTEEEAAKQGVSFAKATFPYRGAGKSVAVEKPDGMVRVLYEPATKEILGAHVVGSDATELIHELLLAKKSELLPEDVATMVHAHPTLSEAVMEAARAAEGWAIHV